MIPEKTAAADGAGLNFQRPTPNAQHPTGETREECRQRLIAGTKERIARAEARRVESYREKDDDGIWLENTLIAECERFLGKLTAAAPTSES